MRRVLTGFSVLCALSYGWAAGCGDDGSSAGAGAAAPTTGEGGAFAVGPGAGGSTGECSQGCADDEICSHGVCLPLAGCEDDNDCQYDTFCDPGVGCLPWEGEDPAFDPDCQQEYASGVLQPEVQCEFAEAPAGDPHPDHLDVQGTPIVIYLVPAATDPDAPPNGPSLIAATFTETVPLPLGYTEDLGVIRILNGADCSQVAILGGEDLDGDAATDWLVSSASLAGADLDDDDRTDIVAYGADGSTWAFHDPGTGWEMLWRAPLPGGALWGACNAGSNRCTLGWAGTSIHDLDDDGEPEVIREGVVFSASGALLSLHPAGWVSGDIGLFPVLANFDGDADIELTDGKSLWAWQGGAWVAETFAAGAQSPGHVGVADFGPYGAGLPSERPEIALVADGAVRVIAATGELVFGPVTLPGAGAGGPPTISDFDGDGLTEIGVAGLAAYSMFDIDCGPTPRAGGICSTSGICDFNGTPAACPQGVAWSRRSQDASSNRTGSSVFDFEANDAAEVVYADECFVRVYDGLSGDVVFSQFRSSCTWYENPIIADVDGDFRAELVTPSNKACSDGVNGVACSMLNGDQVDVLFNGLRCDDGSDCISGSCDAGLCRCAASAECCGAGDDAACVEAGYACVPPEAGTPGSGNTCRATHPHGVSGIRVYADANDLWVPSRRVWNQHAYAVTHIEENGKVPASSAWENNWEEPELNNFRQNVPGIADASVIADATAGASVLYTCDGAGVTLTVPICNRGALPAPAPIPVGFSVDGDLVCSGATIGTIFPGNCETVECFWSSPPTSDAQAVDVTVEADAGNTLNECKEGNNIGGVFDVFCQPPQ